MLLNPIEWCERGWVPDPLTRFGIRRLCAARDRAERGGDAAARKAERIASLRQGPIAIETEAANRQHYELPPEFFVATLGRRLKYSCCYYPRGDESLDDAEEAMLALYDERAELADGQRILELGCGWGSLSLWLAERYPRSRITAVSNSAPQRQFILARAGERGLRNVEVLTCDVNRLELEGGFDRCISIEMFEHMRNYQELLARIARWLRPGGKLFVHVFCHREAVYPFEDRVASDWMSRYFFTGGLMPSFDLFEHFQQDLRLEQSWWIDGRHYQRTANHWLDRLDAQRQGVRPILEQVYGRTEAERWRQRWRMFYMACAELFGYRDGTVWGVGHYRLRRP